MTQENTAPEEAATVADPEESTEEESTESEESTEEEATFDVASLFASDAKDGQWQGETTEEAAESVAATNAAISKEAVSAARGGQRLAASFRKLAEMLLTIRASIIIVRPDGTSGPDWEARSDLAKRHSTAVISNPIIATKGMSKADVEYVQANISAYYSKKEPGTEHSLRDRFIREHVRSTMRDLGGEPLSPEAVEAAVDAEFKAIDKSSDRMKSKARQDRRDLAPNTSGPAAVTESLSAAVQAVATAEAGVAPLVLVTEGHKLMSKLGLACLKSTGDGIGIQDRPAVQEAFRPFSDLVQGIEAFLNGNGSAVTVETIRGNLYETVSKLLTDAKLADMLDGPAEESEEEAATEEAATATA